MNIRMAKKLVFCFVAGLCLVLNPLNAGRRTEAMRFFPICG